MNQEIYEELLSARTLITDTKDFESMFEDILTMVIPPWIINPYGDIEETNVIIQEELTELSTNEELKVQFKNGYQQFWLQNNIPVSYPGRIKFYWGKNGNVNNSSRSSEYRTLCAVCSSLIAFSELSSVYSSLEGDKGMCLQLEVRGIDSGVN
ncbi:unnamed protein product [Acanthoscelides obtectus]|uniref:Uncharacterized protein n=1 Tax=Acanthoscelides obtectus TaxID=200917 RepID=A0A9P0MAU4_ACAOB|nr:unnamed protein product [Acanthoscelides obtectus]CAK1675057.1 hypothetical protein AOBTE_LOCUS29872 [Acanthoscelides obtectus]